MDFAGPFAVRAEERSQNPAKQISKCATAFGIIPG